MFMVSPDMDVPENAVDSIVVLHLSVAATIRAIASRASAPSRFHIGAARRDGFGRKHI